MRLDVPLFLQPLGDVHSSGKPGRIKHGEVVGIYGCVEAVSQGIATEKDGKRANTGFQLSRARDDAPQRLRLSPITGNGMEARRSTGCLIRLSQCFDRQAQYLSEHVVELAVSCKRG